MLVLAASSNGAACFVGRPVCSGRRCGTAVALGGLPEPVERLLPAVALKDRASVLPLWKALRQCYPTEAQAIEALRVNRALCLPWVCESEREISPVLVRSLAVCTMHDGRPPGRPFARRHRLRQQYQRIVQGDRRTLRRGGS
eukprot:7006738-Prymnesium_polylepis.1